MRNMEYCSHTSYLIIIKCIHACSKYFSYNRIRITNEDNCTPGCERAKQIFKFDQRTTREGAGIGNSRGDVREGQISGAMKSPIAKGDGAADGFIPGAISAAKCHHRSNANWSCAVESVRPLWRSLSRSTMNQQRDLRGVAWRGGDGWFSSSAWFSVLIARITRLDELNSPVTRPVWCTVHKVAGAQTPTRYVPSLTRDVRIAKGHYPGTWRDSPSIHPTSRRVFERPTMIYRSSPRRRDRRASVREEQGDLWSPRERAPGVSRLSQAKQDASHLWNLFTLKLSRTCHHLRRAGLAEFFSSA